VILKYPVPLACKSVIAPVAVFLIVLVEIVKLPVLITPVPFGSKIKSLLPVVVIVEFEREIFAT
jgi:hypothetical protein